ncbi:MAG TPA: zf-HC2 domain-containing protein [Thermoanaerobaculia bacterium]|nr:zf-HC2 domain-containing protein [Thermoanaerobaculia bacterium]
MDALEHDTYREWLDPSRTGELSAAEEAQLSRHLSQCASCREELEVTTRLNALLVSDRIEPRADLVDMVMARLPEAGWQARHPRSWLPALAALTVIGSGAAALLGGGAAEIEPHAPFLGALAALFELFKGALLAGAGLLRASWHGVGLAVGNLLTRSWLDSSLTVIGVLSLDLLLLALYRRYGRQRRPAESIEGRWRADRDR